MSEPDDKALDEYLRRDSELSRQYRRVSDQDVPAELDRRVLAQARAALETSRPSSARHWRRWSTPLALAASVALAVMVVVEIGTREQSALKPADIQTQIIAEGSGSEAEVAGIHGRETADNAALPMAGEPSMALRRQVGGNANANRTAEADATRVNAAADNAKAKARADAAVEAVASQSFAAAASPPATPSAQVGANAALREEPAAGAPKEERLEAQPSAPAPEIQLDHKSEDKEELRIASPPPPSPVVANPSVVSLSEAAKSSITLQRAAAPTAPVSRPPPTADEQRLRSDPKRWLDHIQDLRKRGETEKAAEELKQFKAAWPNYPVSEDIAKPSKN